MIDVAALTPSEHMELISLIVCLPLVLLMNFALFQYLLTMFFRRRHEPLVMLLLGIAFLSFFSLVPFGFPDLELVRDLNDISETCSVLTFLLQICILTRDINKKMKIHSLVVLLYVGELLVLFGLVVIVLNILEISAPDIPLNRVEFLDDLVEDLSLAFIVGYRFYFLSLAKGWRAVLKTQKTEIGFYLLFLTHEYPFMVLNHLTDMLWEHVQGVWMRVTIVLCLWMTIKARLSSRNSRFAGRTTLGQTTNIDRPAIRRGNGPSEASTGPAKKSGLHFRCAAAVAPLQASSTGID